MRIRPQIVVCLLIVLGLDNSSPWSCHHSWESAVYPQHEPQPYRLERGGKPGCRLAELIVRTDRFRGAGLQYDQNPNIGVGNDLPKCGWLDTSLMQLPSLPHTQMIPESVLAGNLDPVAVANRWFQAFAPLVEHGDSAGILGLLTEDSFWRDALALTWDLRTFDGPTKIKRFLDDRLNAVKLTNLKLGDPRLVDNSPVSVWIQSIFTFGVGGYGLGTGVLRLVPTSTGGWKGYTIYTSLRAQRLPRTTGRAQESASEPW